MTIKPLNDRVLIEPAKAEEKILTARRMSEEEAERILAIQKEMAKKKK